MKFLSYRTNIETSDEIGSLAKSFNVMTEELEIAYADVETRVEDRTEKLVKLNGLMVGREVKMVELKKEIAELKSKITDSNDDN